jgi:DNA-binding GntR family transcriptional regulator
VAGASTPRVTLADQTYELLRSRITSLEMAPASWFNERELSSNIGLGAMPLREALDRLEAVGLVRAVPRRGHQVTPITPKHVQDAFDMLSFFAPSLFTLALRKVSDETVDKVCRNLEGELKAWRAGRQTRRRWMEQCGTFFDLVVDVADNEHYQALWRRMDGINQRLFSLAFAYSTELPGIEMASDMLAAFRKRDQQAAMVAAKRFVEDTRKFVLVLIDTLEQPELAATAT